MKRHIKLLGDPPLSGTDAIKAVGGQSISQHLFLPCVYAMQCVKTGRLYVGSAKSAIRRPALHIVELDSGRHHNGLLLDDWGKYGLAGFRFYFLRSFPTVAECKLHENKIIAQGLQIDLYNIVKNPGNQDIWSYRKRKQALPQEIS